MPRGERQRILVVDDDPAVRGVVRFTLEDAGYEVLEVDDGRRALDAIAQTSPDLIVLDLAMPGASGFEVLDARRERRLVLAARVLVLTGRTDPRDLDRSIELGADDFLVKPFDPDDLARKVADLLAGAPSRYTEREAGSILADLDAALGDD